MTERFKAAAKDARYEFIVERSRFLGQCFRVTSEEGAREKLLIERKRYSDATHNCYAYVADRAGNVKKFSDDGEPQGTAGMPILEVIERRGLSETLVVVTRYFGGIKLGAGGLVRAYTEAAAGALNAAGEAEWTLAAFYRAELDFSAYARIRQALAALPLTVLGTDYGENVTVRFVSAEKNAEQALVNAANGRVKVTLEKQDYYPFQREVN